MTGNSPEFLSEESELDGKSWMHSIANVTSRTTDWNSIIWRKATRIVKKLRQRIFRASLDSKWKKVRSLQKLLMRCYSNILLAVRRITQINGGKNTAGVDKLVVKTPAARGLLVDILCQFIPWKPLPSKRVYISKPNGKLRPLSIPSIIDRCLQAIVKNALEPAWEAQFEGISYGFRPGRSAHDAIGKVYLIACPHKTKKWVVDADIKGCFDNIAHEPLMKAIGNFPARKLIYQWLKAGYMEKGAFHETDTGTAQGSIISPLLANIALHGMEKALGVKYDCLGRLKGKRALVRFADDFVVFCETLEDASKTVLDLKQWLSQKGLTLSDEKTRIIHLSEGFNFLSFNVRQYKVNNTKTGWKLLIKPSRQAIREIKLKIKKEWRQLQGQNVSAVVKKLNPIIRGWANYHKVNVASETFKELDDWMYKREWRYVKLTHPNKRDKWRKSRYFGKLNLDRNDHWVFGDKKTGIHILKFSWIKIDRHTLVEKRASPDNPSLTKYWQDREAALAKNLTPSSQKIAKRQKHVCTICGESLYNGEEIHIHHKTERSKGGKNIYSNLEMLHLFCHQQKHAAHRRKSKENPKIAL